MDNKDFNRDKLLNDILRETAAQKDAAAPRQSAPTPPPRTSSRIGTGCAPAEPADCIPAGSTGISAGKRSAGAGQQHPDHPV